MADTGACAEAASETILKEENSEAQENGGEDKVTTPTRRGRSARGRGRGRGKATRTRTARQSAAVKEDPMDPQTELEEGIAETKVGDEGKDETEAEEGLEEEDGEENKAEEKNEEEEMEVGGDTAEGEEATKDGTKTEEKSDVDKAGEDAQSVDKAGEDAQGVDKAGEDAQGKEKQEVAEVKPTPKPKEKTKTNTEFCMLCFCDSTGAHMTGPFHQQNVKVKARGGKVQRKRPVSRSPFVELRLMIPQMQEEIDACTDPIVGIHYVCEYQHEDEGVENRYVCYLCEKTVEKTQVVDHLKESSHYLEYMKVALPETYKELKEIEDKEEQEAKLKENAAKIEKRTLEIKIFLASHRKLQKASFPKFPLTVLNMRPNKGKQNVIASSKDSIGWQHVTKYIQDGIEDDAIYTCDVCNGYWYYTVKSFHRHMYTNSHKERYMAKYYKDLYEQYTEEIQNVEKKATVISKYVAMIKEADGRKYVRIKKLIIPFTDDDLDLGGKKAASENKDTKHKRQGSEEPISKEALAHPRVKEHLDKMVRGKSGFYSVCFETVKDLSQEKLKTIFSKVGSVKEVHFSKRYTFIRYDSKREVIDALIKFGDEYDVQVPQCRPQREQGGQLQPHGSPRSQQGVPQQGGRKRRTPQERGPVPSLQPLLDACAEPTLGLQYVVAEQGEEPGKWFYRCNLCKLVQRQAAVTILAHITGNKHRTEYMKKHYPNEAILTGPEAVEQARQLVRREKRQRIVIQGQGRSGSQPRRDASYGPPSKAMRFDNRRDSQRNFGGGSSRGANRGSPRGRDRGSQGSSRHRGDRGDERRRMSSSPQWRFDYQPRYGSQQYSYRDDSQQSHYMDDYGDSYGTPRRQYDDQYMQSLQTSYFKEPAAQYMEETPRYRASDSPQGDPYGSSPTMSQLRNRFSSPESHRMQTDLPSSRDGGYSAGYRTAASTTSYGERQSSQYGNGQTSQYGDSQTFQYEDRQSSQYRSHDRADPPQAQRRGTGLGGKNANRTQIFTLLEGLIETMKTKNNPQY